ncbi:MAG: glycerol-3-phosphate acyltransferase, partial [Trueperaceae bacterium]|nr:glycerol-3-phosphate acyltransferase [Trueperaceae bacterium]
YVLGAIPSAALAARLKGHRIFDVGSGNMGAMNTARNLGWGLGVAVFAADVGKGALATLLGLAMARAVGFGPEATLTTALAAGFGAVVGHAWSVYVRFRGGKALATIFGASLPLYPLGGLAGMVLLVALTLLSRRPQAAAIVTLAAYPVVVALAERRAGADLDTAFALFTGTLPLALVALWKHRRPKVAAPTEG